MATADSAGDTDATARYATRIAEATDTIELVDGRTLAYCTVGDPTGSPVFVCHGGVGSRGFGLLFEEAASDAGIRIVSPDRPGYGRSDPLPDRDLRDWAADVDQLADALGIGGFGVVGVSGGGPYAAACAFELPDRVTSAALVSSMPPPGGPRPRALAVLGWLARWLPWIPAIPIKRRLRRAQTDPAAAIEARARGKAAPEAAMHRGDAGLRLTAQTAEAGRQGHRHAVQEIAVASRPWGFALADIAVPVGVWHGRLDQTVPVDASRYLAADIPNAQLTVHDDVGHLSLPVQYAPEILAFVRSVDSPD